MRDFYPDFNHAIYAYQRGKINESDFPFFGISICRKGDRFMTTAYYQHIIDLRNSRTRTEAWDIRLERYRKWIRQKRDYNWPTSIGTFS